MVFFFQIMSAIYENIIKNKMLICRSCLSTTNHTEELFENNSNLQYLYTICTSLTVSKTDGLPSQLCKECVSNLHSLFDFRIRSIKSNKILMHCFKSNDKNESKPVDEEIQIEEDNINFQEQVESLHDLRDFSKSEDDENVPLINISKKMKCIISKNISEPKSNLSEHKEIDTSMLPDKLKINRIKKGQQRYKKKFKPTNQKISSVCLMCGEKFVTKEDLLSHKEIHYKFKCKMCKMIFKNILNTPDHGCTSRETESVIGCDLDSDKKISDRVKENNAWEKSSTDHSIYQRIFHCHVCDKELMSPRNLKNHLRTHTGEKPHLCSICGKGFGDRRALTIHNGTIHNREERFKCSFCPKSFTVSGKKTQHERIHTGEKPYQCNFCCRLFAARSTLNAHIRIHTKQNKFICKLQGCDKGFYSFSTYQRHIWSHRGERPYQCERCPKTYLSKQNLGAHFKAVHSKLKDQICHVCNKDFTQTSALNRHLRSVHKTEPIKSKRPIPAFGFSFEET